MADIKVRKHPIINNLKQESQTPGVNEQSDILEELKDLKKFNNLLAIKQKHCRSQSKHRKLLSNIQLLVEEELREQYIPELMRQQKSWYFR